MYFIIRLYSKEFGKTPTEYLRESKTELTSRFYVKQPEDHPGKCACTAIQGNNRQTR